VEGVCRYCKVIEAFLHASTVYMDQAVSSRTRLELHLC